jgi:hypothetical protein
MVDGTTLQDDCVDTISVQGSWDAFEYLDAARCFENKLLSGRLPVDLVLLDILSMGIDPGSVDWVTTNARIPPGKGHAEPIIRVSILASTLGKSTRRKKRASPSGCGWVHKWACAWANHVAVSSRRKGTDSAGECRVLLEIRHRASRHLASHAKRRPRGKRQRLSSSGNPSGGLV